MWSSAGAHCAHDGISMNRTEVFGSDVPPPNDHHWLLVAAESAHENTHLKLTARVDMSPCANFDGSATWHGFP